MDLAGFGANHFGFTIIGIGLIGGVGAGLAYIVPIATCIRWFPKRKGLVTGIAVAGFGGGAAFVSQAAGMMINSMGKSPFEAFTLFGMTFLILVSIAGSVMKNPPDAETKNERHSSAIRHSCLREFPDPLFCHVYCPCRRFCSQCKS